jgi:hypothetical protein
MTQIALGDASAGWLVLSGSSADSPFKRASFSPRYSSDKVVEDEIALSLEGTPDQISEGLAALEKIQQRAAHYSQGRYASPQVLRFQPAVGSECFLAPLVDLHFAFNTDGYSTHQTGSLQVTLYFKHPNHFDSEQIELPLTNRSGTGITGGITIVNHTDCHAGHDSSILIVPEDIDSALPAPLRFELENTAASGILKDVLVGHYHHPIHAEAGIFFLQMPDFTGGSLLHTMDAINEYFCRLVWSATNWTDLGCWTLNNAQVSQLSGCACRPILHFFNSHLYDDLFLKIKLQKGSCILWEGDAVYADPSYQYVLFPPIRIPPHRLLGEEIPHHIDITIYGQHKSSASYTIDIDQLHLMPLDTSASFLGFYDMHQDDVLIDDSFRGLHNVRYATLGSETAAHLRQGGPLLIYPGEYNRLFFVLADESNQMDILRTARVRAYYRKRVRIP